jgi:hypothetical protein
MGAMQVMLSQQEMEDLLTSLFNYKLQSETRFTDLGIKPNREEKEEMKRLEKLQVKLQRILIVTGNNL